MDLENSELRFERPSAARAGSFAAMRDAFVVAGEERWKDAMAIAHRDAVAYVEMCCSWSEGIGLPVGWVPVDVLWIVLEDIVVGESAVRHALTPALEAFGGHIGYSVHPGYRNRGIATRALRDALGRVARFGVQDALLTCAFANAASARVIERCGGRRIADTKCRRYLISTVRD